MDWAIYAALIAGFLAVAGSAVFLAVRILEAWRELKRFRRHVGRALDRLTDAADETARASGRAADQTRLNESLGRLRVSVARLAVLRAAVDESTGIAGRVTAVVPRK